MKTVIQELIEGLKKRRSSIKEAYKPLSHLVDANSLVDIMIRQIDVDIELAESMLKKEKEQIINAYKVACVDGVLFDENSNEERAEQYYNETYTNPDQV